MNEQQITCYFYRTLIAKYINNNIIVIVIVLLLLLLLFLFLPRDARSAKRGIAIVSRPSVRPSVRV